MVNCKIKKSWINLEMEHTKSKMVARKIVKDHIREFGCSYYPSLKKMEKNILIKRGMKR